MRQVVAYGSHKHQKVLNRKVVHYGETPPEKN